LYNKAEKDERSKRKKNKEIEEEALDAYNSNSGNDNLSVVRYEKSPLKPHLFSAIFEDHNSSTKPSLDSDSSKNESEDERKRDLLFYELK
jgi:hypothetical protein